MAATRCASSSPLQMHGSGSHALHVSVSLLLLFVARGLAYRVGDARELPKDFVCPDGWVCELAECDIENSNGKPGPDCACKDGFIGEIAWSGSHASGRCEPAPCTVPNSNGMLGPDCACADGFAGEISWEGANHEGNCEPAPCTVPLSNGKPGLDCECDMFSRGVIEWHGSTAVGQCRDRTIIAISLFDASSMLTFKGKTVKCCVSSTGLYESQLIDLTQESLPSTRDFGSTWGCGRLLGDTWHSARHPNIQNKCDIKLGDLLDKFNIARGSFAWNIGSDSMDVTLKRFFKIRKM